MLNLEITEIVLVHCYIVNNDYKQEPRVLYTFVPSKSFGQLLGFSPKIFSDFSYIEEYFTDQNSKPPEIEDKNKHYFSY